MLFKSHFYIHEIIAKINVMKLSSYIFLKEILQFQVLYLSLLYFELIFVDGFI